MIARPTADDVARLAAIEEYPCVTVLLPTTPADRPAEEDLALLEALCTDAVRRVRAEGHPDEAVIERRLADLVAQVAEAATDTAVALLVNADVAEVFHLTDLLAARVVVDPTFATRDLLATVHGNPPYLLLDLALSGARLFEHDGRRMAEVHDGTFPLPAPGDFGWHRHRSSARRFVAGVDAALAGSLGRRRPLVVVADDVLLVEFLDCSAHRDRAITLGRASVSGTGPRALESAIRPLLMQRLDDLREAAQETLSTQDAVVTGLGACWEAAGSRTPQLLLVEQSYAPSARLTPHGLRMADDREHPEVIDDAVDELVELVCARGGAVRFVPDGSLQWADRVALAVAT
jgi:hypothetical protein